MINLRYHIVSITAVFLALGIGVTMGSTFIDRATVDTLKNQLDTLEGDLRDADARVGELNGRLGELEQEQEAFAEQAPEVLFPERLTDVPVIALAVAGTDQAMVDRAMSTLTSAGATVDGVWWVSDRLVLDDSGELRDLADVLGLPTDSEVRLRRSLAQRLGDALLDRVTLPELDEDGVPVGTTTTPPDPETPVSPPDTSGGPIPGRVPEPLLFSALRDAGFLEFRAVGDAPEELTLPAADARLVLLTGSGAQLTPDQFLRPLVQSLTEDGPTPLIVAEGLTVADEEQRATAVDTFRSDEATAPFLTTIDDLERFAGWAALVVAVDDLGDLRLGHYGLADSASRLLPAPEAPA